MNANAPRPHKGSCTGPLGVELCAGQYEPASSMCSMCSAHKAFNNRVSQQKLCEKVGRALQSLKAIHDAAGRQLPLARLHYLDAKVQKTHFTQQPWPFTQAYEVHAEECFTWHLSWGTRRADDKRPPTETTSWSTHHEDLWQWVPATVATQERAMRDDFDADLVKMARSPQTRYSWFNHQPNLVHVDLDADGLPVRPPQDSSRSSGHAWAYNAKSYWLEINYEIDLPPGIYDFVLWFLPRSTDWLWDSMETRAGYPLPYELYKDLGPLAKVGELPWLPHSRYVKKRSRKALKAETVRAGWYREVLRGHRVELVSHDPQVSTRVIVFQRNNVVDMLFGGMHILPRSE